MESNEPLCLISNTNNNKELIFETHTDQNQKPKKDEIKDEIFFDHDSKQSLPIDSEDEKSDNESCDRDVDPTSHRSKSPISPKKQRETGVDKLCGDELVSAETESLDVESLGAKHEILPFDSEINSEKAAMFKVYQPWVIKTYGDFTKTKTVSLKKYDRIVRTLLGLIPNCAENSKFRFWIRSKGFRLGLPSSIAPVSDPNQLYVLGRKSGTEGRSYRKVAVVEQFFEIIYQVHVESGGKHAGQKKTYRTITQTYAFLPREAVTKFLLGCAECQKRLDLDSLGSDIFKNNKDTPVKRAQKRKHNTWDPSPSSFSIDPSCFSTNLSIPLDNRKRKYLKLPKYPSELCLADDEGNNSDGYVPTDKYEGSLEFYPTCKESSTRNPTKAIEYHHDDKLFQVATKTESDGEEESKAEASLKLCIKEETDEKTDLVLDFRYKSLKSLARQKFKDQDKDTEDSEKDDASDVERKYGCESNKLHPKLDSRDPLYKIKSEFYLRHQIDHQNVRKERDYFVNVPNLLPPAPVLSLRLGHEDGYPSETKITDPVRACNSKKYLLPHVNGSSRRKRFSSKRYTSTPEPMSHLYSRNSSQSLRYGPRNSSSSTNENESCENSYGAEILDLSPINSQNRISKFKLPQSRAPVSYIQIPVWNPDLLRYHSKGRTMESGRTARVPDADPSECPDRLSAHPTDEDSDSDHPTSTCERRTKHVGYFDQEPTSSQANMMTTEMETTDDDHFSSRNGELRLSEDLPGEEMGGSGLWPSYPLGLKKSTSTPPGSRDLSSPVILQETGSVHDETSSSGNKEDEDEDEEDVDDLKTLPHDPERLKAFNMFVRLFVDENLDRIVPISKQPKEKIQAIIDSCTRQFPEFAERARKRIRTYLKSCRRNKRARDPGNWPEANRPTPAHLTSVQAEQILAQACENESHNAKRMRLGLEPVSQPMPVLPGQTEQPRPIDHFSSSSLTTTTTSSLNNNTPSSGSNTSISQTDTASTETKEPPGAGGSGKTVLQQHLINNNNNIANNNNIKDVLNFTKGLTATSINSDHSSSKTTNSRSSLSSSSALNGSPVVSRMEASPLYRPNPAFSQAFSPRGVSSQTSIYAGASPNMFSASPFGPAGMMGNGPTDLSMKQASKPLLNHKLSPAEMAAVRQLITGYRESAAFLLRSADELETLLLQQP